MTSRTTSLLALLLVLSAASARADVAVLAPSQDNTLYENATGALSNGAGPTAFAGRSGQPVGTSIRRGLIYFTTGAIPAGSTITSVRLDLHVSMVANATPRRLDLHRVFQSWGEGTSNAGTPGATGAPAAFGDATWLHRFSVDSLWFSPGGDFLPQVIGTQTVTGVGFYSFGSTPDMVADVQDWLDFTPSDLGWLVQGDESVGGTAVRYDTRENADPTFRPVLTVEYTPPVTAAGTTSWGHIKALFR